jgi:hypothetical protein
MPANSLLQGIFTDQYKPLFDAWMKGTGPAHLFVYYQMPYTMNEAGEIEDVKGAHKPQFYVTDGKLHQNHKRRQTLATNSFPSATRLPDPLLLTTKCR